MCVVDIEYFWALVNRIYFLATYFIRHNRYSHDICLVTDVFTLLIFFCQTLQL